MRAVERAIAERHPSAVRIIGDGEIAWRGTEILDIFKELSAARFAILGLEVVYIAAAGSTPIVEPINDLSGELSAWQKEYPWEKVVQLTLQKSITDINRNVANPYNDDVWYVVVTQEGPDH
jgi:hypothetical protein